MTITDHIVYYAALQRGPFRRKALSAWLGESSYEKLYITASETANSTRKLLTASPPTILLQEGKQHFRKLSSKEGSPLFS